MTDADTQRLKAMAVEVMDFQGLKNFMSDDDISEIPDHALRMCVVSHLLGRVRKYVEVRTGMDP